MHKFEENDIFRSFIKANPRYRISMYWNNMYINDRPQQGAAVHSGSLSLYEMNVDSTGSGPPEIFYVRAFVTEGENLHTLGFKSAQSSAGQISNVAAGDSTYQMYPLTASIHRELVIGKANRTAAVNSSRIHGVAITESLSSNATVSKLIALRNTFNYYRPMSPYYDFDKYIFVSGGVPEHQINKTKGKEVIVYGPSVNHCAHPLCAGATSMVGHPVNSGIILTESIPRQDFINLIIVPKLMYGSKIKKGSIDLKFYYTGSLLARAQDVNRNGELIETYNAENYAANYSVAETGSVIGMALYNEGALVITGNYPLSPNHTSLDAYLSPEVIGTALGSITYSSTWTDRPKWVHFGAHRTFQDYVKDSNLARLSPASSSYTLEFEGTTEIPVLTMLAQAKKNELNWSNNPTFIDRDKIDDAVDGRTRDYHEIYVGQTGSYLYKENENISIKNIVSSSFYGHSASYAQETFISKIGIYDDEKRLIAIAKLSTPVKKTNEQDYTFKLKLDL